MIYCAMALLKFPRVESHLLTADLETFRGSAQARPKQALHDTSINTFFFFFRDQRGRVWDRSSGPDYRELTSDHK